MAIFVHLTSTQCKFDVKLQDSDISHQNCTSFPYFSYGNDQNIQSSVVPFMYYTILQ